MNKNIIFHSKQYKLSRFEWTDYLNVDRTEELRNVFNQVMDIRNTLEECDKNNINSATIEVRSQYEHPYGIYASSPKAIKEIPYGIYVYSPKAIKEIIVLSSGLFSHWCITYVFENIKESALYLLFRNCSNSDGDINLYDVIPNDVKDKLNNDY